MATAAHQAVVNALNVLSHIDDIPGHLKATGMRGVVGEPAACPVAVYVVDQAGVDVLIHQITWEFDPPGTSGGLLPAPVAAFVHEFDRGLHPDRDRTRPE